MSDEDFNTIRERAQYGRKSKTAAMGQVEGIKNAAEMEREYQALVRRSKNALVGGVHAQTEAYWGDMKRGAMTFWRFFFGVKDDETRS